MRRWTLPAAATFGYLSALAGASMNGQQRRSSLALQRDEQQQFAVLVDVDLPSRSDAAGVERAYRAAKPVRNPLPRLYPGAKTNCLAASFARQACDTLSPSA